jgi:glucose-1-phosphate cytidylyltransferase
VNLKAVILAGGLGTRLSEETSVRPKPMVEIGGKPILWHIMKIYSAHGVNEFLVCLGYKGYMIKEYFANYYLHTSDVTFEIAGNSMEVHHNSAEPWRVTLVDTGDNTMTGGRLLRVKKYLQNDAAFCFTYGDGVSNVDIGKLLRFHASHGKLVTVTGTQPPGRFGALSTEGDRLLAFQEKPFGDGGWVNGGFFVLSPQVFDVLADDSSIWEREPLEKLALTGQVMVFRHSGFWQPMDTLRDKAYLEELWNSGRAPWKIW